MWFALAVAALMPQAPDAIAADQPFEFKGVIEGFYGPPWSAGDRIDFMRWMSDHRLNAYVHAPKNDPYQRLQWREPYPPSDMEQFAREVAASAPRGLQWIPSISPGMPLLEAAQTHDPDICFSCPQDRAVLFAKLDAFWAIGVRQYMLSFDDVVKASSHLEDAAAYGVGDYAYGLMNADLLNAVYDRYASRDPSFRLLTVPADYSGTSATPYLEALRSKLRPEVVVMWTGTSVVSPTVRCDEANAFAKAIGRKPLLWDNFPVNDYSTTKLMVGPYAGRAPDLPSCLAGILSNPANQITANRIPLYTVADYLNDPRGYQPERSWEASLREFAGPYRELAGLFLENVRSTALDRTESVRFTALRDAFLTALDGDGWPEAHRALVDYLRRAAAAPELLRSSLPNRRFVEEIDSANPGSWLARLGFTSSNALEAAQALARTRARVTARFHGDELTGQVAAPMSPAAASAAQGSAAGMRNRDDGNPANVYGDRTFVPIGPPYTNENRVDALFDAATQRLGAYAPQAQSASSAVSLTVDGKPVQLALGGTFAVNVSGREAVAIATDGAGHRSRYIFAKPAAATSLKRRFVLGLGRSTRLRARNGIVRVKVTCAGAEQACSGTLTMTALKRQIARTAFLVPEGATAQVRVRLTRGARSLLHQRRALRVLVRCTARDKAGARARAGRRATLR